MEANLPWVRLGAWTRGCLCALTLTGIVAAQAGDKRGEVQPDPPAEWKIPPAPVLSPKDAQKTFALPEGFRLELVAAEPLTEDPVAVAFDGSGRLYVAEMRAFMPNVDGKGEDERIGVIAVLEDTDGDGRMDKRTEFADDLVLPRALTIQRGGVLFIEPPYMRWFKDTDGDLEWDEDSIVSYGFGGLRNVEHAPNALTLGLDNWIHLANHPGRFRFKDGRWHHQPMAAGGQWGLGQDDHGRLYHNHNGVVLRGNAYSPAYAVRNPNLGTAWGMSLGVSRSNETYPARITPGVNRGYRKGTLRKDGTLRVVTAACGPTVFHGDAYGPEFDQNAFICEPAGNLIKRVILEEDESNGTVRARDAYDKAEFLTSTDERFRPVNLITGPDGCLWIVDMYRGILQHRIYVTTYLRKQILKRGLDRPVGLGRIWRVVPDGFARPAQPRLDDASPAELVKALSHANGWWRSTARRLLIERSDQSVVPSLRELARRDGRGRLPALWTLEGLGALDGATVLSALDDPNAKVREHGLRLAEALIEGGKGDAVRARVLAMRHPSGRALRRQLLLTLGQIGGLACESAMERILRENCETASERHAAVSGLYGRELAFLERLVGNRAWHRHARGRDALLKLLASCVTKEERGDRVRALIALAARSDVDWHRVAILAGVADTRPRPPKKPRPLRLDGEPAGLNALIASRHEPTRDLSKRIAAFTTWPGHADWARLRLRPLTATEKALFDRGRQFYTMVCRGCHQDNGRGMDGLAPPLRGSEWVTGPTSRLTRILVNGVGGPIEVAGKTYDLQMPGLSSFSDEEIAAVLTYIRRSFGHEADPVTEAEVTRERKAIGTRTKAWSARELLGVK